MLIGYARVSTQDQILHLQKDALEKIGCTKIFTDIVSGATTERQGLDEALQFLIEVVADLEKREIGFKSLTENIDTTTSGGKLIFHIFGALAEFERNLIRERTQAGLLAARARGRKGGRPKSLMGKKAAMAQQLYNDKNN